MKKIIKKNINDIKKVIHNSKLSLSYIKNEKSGKKYFFYKAIQSIVNAFSPLVYITLPGVLINFLTEKDINIINCIITAGIIIISPVLSYFINIYLSYKLKRMKSKIGLEIDLKFYQHSFKMDYESYENPDMQIKMERSKNALTQVWKISDILFGFISQLLSLITVITVISFLNPLLILITIIFSIIISLIKKAVNKKLFSLDQEGSKLDRKKWGTQYMIEKNDYAKEVRLFQLETLLLNEYRKIENESINLDMKYFKMKDIPNHFNTTFNLLEKIAVYGYLIYQVINKYMLIGNFTIYISYYNNFRTTLNNSLASFIELSRISLNVGELNQFMSLPTKLHSSGTLKVDYDDISVIEFKNVSFKYPGSTNYALKDINVKINCKEKLCIVGDNGAGKTTFIKLLTRLYDPTEGVILLNGKDISQYDYNEYLKIFSPVFQDFAQYYLSLGINIALIENFDLEKLEKVVKNCGLLELVEKLPKKYDTQVNKWIDSEGIEPSGGESQRIAIARALYHGGEIYILDEPTASLDPDAEYEIYTQFSNMIENKTAVLITHRLSAVQLADVVAVFEKGKIIEYGTHKTLYDMNGKYRSMFDKQAKFYHYKK